MAGVQAEGGAEAEAGPLAGAEASSEAEAPGRAQAEGGTRRQLRSLQADMVAGGSEAQAGAGGGVQQGALASPEAAFEGLVWALRG